MAASRSRPDLQVRLPPKSPASPALPSALPELPPVSALFLIDFDVKAGYTLSWKAAHPGVELEGVVEYKSLPSGLHTVKDDLIYFVHDGFAGLSAFVNAPVDDSEARNACMLAVGVLVPLSYGRLGRAWRHAEGLRHLASQLLDNGKDVSILAQYWEKNQARGETTQQAAPASSRDLPPTPTVTFQQPAPSNTPTRKSAGRSRSASDGMALLPAGHRLSSFHPAWSLTHLLDVFGPLIFPIQRAALLRKRILISCHAPVREACNFVYDISILSNIPLSTYELMGPGCPSHRLRPLFTVGVHDIPFLMEDARPKAPGDLNRDPESGTGWIACTTDSILAMKDTLWDMLIILPPPHASAAKKHVWPTVECPRGTPIKATQRDLRRFKTLKQCLARLKSQSSAAAGSPDVSPSAAHRPPSPRNVNDEPLLDEAEPIVEPMSWAALAYNGFMWWASAGEQARSAEAEESSHDAGLLADFLSPTISMSTPRTADLAPSTGSPNVRRRSSAAGGGGGPAPSEEARAELAIIAYFHRLTTQMLTKMADMVENGIDCDGGGAEGELEEEEEDVLLPGAGSGDRDDSDDDGGEGGIRIRSDGVMSMGLDIWSASDADFVRQLVAVYFGRTALVEGKGVEVCGVRVC